MQGGGAGLVDMVTTIPFANNTGFDGGPAKWAIWTVCDLLNWFRPRLLDDISQNYAANMFLHL